jgi:hypothetical protein
MTQHTCFGIRLNNSNSLSDILKRRPVDEEIDELLNASEPMLSILARIQRRRDKKTLNLQI